MSRLEEDMEAVHFSHTLRILQAYIRNYTHRPTKSNYKSKPKSRKLQRAQIHARREREERDRPFVQPGSNNSMSTCPLYREEIKEDSQRIANKYEIASRESLHVN